jgi:hypothetical protein
MLVIVLVMVVMVVIVMMMMVVVVVVLAYLHGQMVLHREGFVHAAAASWLHLVATARASALIISLVEAAWGEWVGAVDHHGR